MKLEALVSRSFQPNWRGLLDAIRREGTPDRVYFMELFHDVEIRDAIAAHFGLTEGLDPSDPDFEKKTERRANKIVREWGFEDLRKRRSTEQDRQRIGRNRSMRQALEA